MAAILIVDDDPYVRHLVKNIPEQDGMPVHCAENSEAALSELRQNSFNLMITDYDMPGLDGLSLPRQATVLAPDMPVILMPGNILSELPSLAEQTGIAKVLGKPFSCEALLVSVRGVIGCVVDGI